MRNRIIVVILIALLAVLSVIVIERTYFKPSEKVFTGSRVVIPQVDGDNFSDSVFQDDDFEENVKVSLIPLGDTETLIDTADYDFDGDGLLDQINAIRSASSPYISLIVGLCNPLSRRYERLATIATPVRQVRTFSYMGIDLTGEHKNALVYQGILDNGNSVLQAFAISRNKDASIAINPLVHLESDGTIFIQQEEREAEYDFLEADGQSYAIWVYSSDSSSPNAADQVHTKYEWNPKSKVYERTEQVTVSANTIASRELSTIQDGTEASFASFLDGLWLRNERGDSSETYIFFDYEQKQIIFMRDDEQTVYDWQNSTVRRGGMYINSTNLEIENLQRRIDIFLRNTDEVQVSVHDDVRLPITESSNWDGVYKKPDNETLRALVQNDAALFTAAQRFVQALEEGPQWKMPDGTVISFDRGMYAAWGEEKADEGRFTALMKDGSPFMQFRPRAADSVFSKMYKISYATFQNSEVEDTDSIVLEPYVITPHIEYAAAEHTIILTRYDPESEQHFAEEIQEIAETGSLAFTTTGEGPTVTVDSSANPYINRFFSPDGDGTDDVLTMRLECTSPQKIKSWSLVVRDSRSNAVFWRTDGTSMPAVQGKDDTYSTTITWNGRGTSGTLVTSAEDYPYDFTVTDDMGLTSTYSSIIPVDVLVVREGGRLKMQVPSIVFRGDAADFKVTGETDALGNVIEQSSVTREQQQNNVRVLLRIAQILNKFSTYRVTIVGHANPTNPYSGPEENNPEENQDGTWGRALIPLSRERAQYVKDWLVSEGGIVSSRLSVEGKGGLETIANKNDLNNRWRNRRVEFILER